jgi:hypothetical protein
LSFEKSAEPLFLYRLSDMSVKSCIGGALPMLFIIVPGDSNQQSTGMGRVATQLIDYSTSIYLRHGQIAQDYIGLVLASLSNGGTAVENSMRIVTP